MFPDEVEHSFNGAAVSKTDHTPELTKEYLQKDYWDKRFTTEEHYEWCRGYDEFAHLTRPHMRPTDAVLLLGCGNSSLTEQLHADGQVVAAVRSAIPCGRGEVLCCLTGAPTLQPTSSASRSHRFTDITSIDISPVAIERLSAKLAHCPTLRWAVADMLDLGAAVADASFDVVIEKGTLDVLFVDNASPWQLSAAVLERVSSALRGVYAALRPGGVFLSVTFAQPHFRKALLQASPLDWSVQVETFGDDWKYFVYVMRKPVAASGGTSVPPADPSGGAVPSSPCTTPSTDAAEAIVLQSLGYDPERYRSAMGGGSTDHDHMDQEDFLRRMEL